MFSLASLLKELFNGVNVKTPFEAIKKWYEIKPEIFIQKPYEFEKKVLSSNFVDIVLINNLVKLDKYE